MTDQTHCRWVIRADRRSVDLDLLQEELLVLGSTLAGLEVELMSQEAFEAPPDAGAYRDWAPVAVAVAVDPRILEVLAEELILEFGFQIDMFTPESLN